MHGGVARAASRNHGPVVRLTLSLLRVSLQSIIFDEVDLTDASVAESSTKNVNNSFTVSFCSSSTAPTQIHTGVKLETQT